MTLDLTVTDLFCGAGGSSIGAEASGATLKMAANHWRLAIETHNSNFPHADHDCADVSQVNPRRYPRTDILIASPECTWHSPARGNRRPSPDLFGDAAIRSRATMWDVPRFAEQHRYEAVIVENVVEIHHWEPFGSWLQAMGSLGYRHRAVYMNSMVAHPTPQSRDRIYIVFWRKGNTEPDLRFDVSAWCPTCGGQVAAVQSWKRPEKPWGKYRTQYVYRCSACNGIAFPYAYPAASAIDWSLPAKRIGDRERPLADATMRRIRAGLEKYGLPHLSVLRGGQSASGPNTPIPTVTTSPGHFGLVVDTKFKGRGLHVRPTDVPLTSQTGQQTKALVVPLRAHGKAAPVDTSVLPTIVAGNVGHAFCTMPTAFVMRNNRGGAEMMKPVEEPLGTLTATGHQSLVTTPLLVDYHGQGRATPVDRPMGTVDCRDRRALLHPDVEVEDCGFRMLAPHEIGRAMAFPDTYIVHGNKRDRVRQFGNAVTPPVMSKILERVIGSMA